MKKLLYLLLALPVFGYAQDYYLNVGNNAIVTINGINFHRGELTTAYFWSDSTVRLLYTNNMTSYVVRSDKTNFWDNDNNQKFFNFSDLKAWFDANLEPVIDTGSAHLADSMLAMRAELGDTAAAIRSSMWDYPVRFVNASYNVATSDYFVQCTAKNLTITLYTAIGNRGSVVVIDNNSTGNNIITSPQTIDGSVNFTCHSGEKHMFYSDGTVWRTF